MDSRRSYHMTPKLDIFFAFLECDGGSVQLGDNRECTIREGFTVKMQSGKVKVINGSRVILFGIRRDNCVYSLDVHAMAGGTTGAGKAGAVWQEKSRRVWVYILRFKHEAFGKFKEWKQLVENQTRRTVKKLRTDNDLELYNQEFEQLCIESGIARHLTVAGTPQQNGVAERMNRTLIDKVRCLLIHSGLPKTFWAEATCTAAYLINRSPSREIEKKTPMEMWSGHPSDYGMLRIFGCVAYPHDKQGKLEPRAVKCVLLGYPEGVKGYILYRLDGESPKIVTNRNVVFNESVMYKDTLKDSGAGDKSVEELQVEVELQRLNNHTPKEDQKDHEDGDDEDAGDQETDQPPDLTDYQLVQDREPRTRTKPLRFRNESNMAAYAFVAAEEEDTHEPLTYQEAVTCEDSSKWKAAMKEEMDSLRKNNSWELVDHPAGQKLRADYELEQLDVKTAFLHGNLEEVIYMRLPQGYEQDDMLIACKRNAEIGSTKSLLKKEFDMKELGEAKKILGMEITIGKSVKMPLGGHFKLSLKDCPVRDCDVKKMSKVPYANAVGSLMYLMVCTRPGITYAVSVVSRYLANPGKNHWEAVKWILKYSRGSANVGLVYGTNRDNHMDVTGFIDSDYFKDSDKEAEYMALTKAVKEAIWLRGLLEELGVELNIVAVNCDNQGAIHLSRNHVFHERTKHINVLGVAEGVSRLKPREQPPTVKSRPWQCGNEVRMYRRDGLDSVKMRDKVRCGSTTWWLLMEGQEVVDNGDGSALIFWVRYGTGSEVVTGLPERFQEGDIVEALSRVLEQKSSEKGVDSGSGR
ncbi:retrotransposon protein, putative, ty1-copia subclass [Tanacetum coccineum]